MTLKPKSLSPLLIIAIGVVIASIIAGFVIGPGNNGIVEKVLGFSSDFSNQLGHLGVILPFGFAFAAGMVATVNPCGFAMLPAYVTIHLIDNDQNHTYSRKRVRFANQITKAIYVAFFMSLGIILLFGVVGLSISVGARSIALAFPWLGLITGLIICAVGTHMLIKGGVYGPNTQKFVSNIGRLTERTPRGYFIFGMSYAIASLSCTMPIFLAITTSSFAKHGIIGAVGQFIGYGLGMSFTILFVTISVAIFKGALIGKLIRLAPRLNPLVAWVLILTGSYLIFYFLTEGRLATTSIIG